ncbi:MAG: hypothetical protein ACRDRI_09360 [Pseudonocardiaceae bacterium]
MCAYDPWRDAHGAPVPPGRRVEQVVVAKEHGAVLSRLGKRGQVLGRGNTRLTVRFDGEHEPVGIRPHLVRVLDDEPGEHR